MIALWCMELIEKVYFSLCLLREIIWQLCLLLGLCLMQLLFQHFICIFSLCCIFNKLRSALTFQKWSELYSKAKKQHFVYRKAKWWHLDVGYKLHSSRVRIKSSAMLKFDWVSINVASLRFNMIIQNYLSVQINKTFEKLNLIQLKSIAKK